MDKPAEGTTEETKICEFCGLPIDAWQETAEVNGKTLHFDCYREKAGT